MVCLLNETNQGSCLIRARVRVRFVWLVSGFVSAFGFTSGSCLVRVRVRVRFLFGFVSGSCSIWSRLAAGSCLGTYLARIWFVSDSCLFCIWLISISDLIQVWVRI